jgi:glycine cleavage system H protein
MQINDYEIPEGLYYSKEHEWIQIKGDHVIVGITDYAQKSLHEIVYVEFPSVGSELKQMEIMGTVESVKAVSEIFTPISGKVVETNKKLAENPELLSKHPYTDAWIAKVQPTNLKKELENLMSMQEYAKYIRKVEE